MEAIFGPILQIDRVRQREGTDGQGLHMGRLALRGEGYKLGPPGAHPSILELLKLPADVVLLFSSVIQASQSLGQLAHRPVPLPPQVVAERPGRGAKAKSLRGAGDKDSPPAVNTQVPASPSGAQKVA